MEQKADQSAGSCGTADGHARPQAPPFAFVIYGLQDGGFGFRPPAPRGIAQSLEEPAILRQKHPDAMLRQADICGKLRNFCEEIPGHSTTIARDCVHVNARHNVHAAHCIACYVRNMEKGWFERLLKVIEHDGRSKMALSLEAKFGRNYVQQMIRHGKEPGADHLARLLDILGPHAALYVYTGLELTDQDLAFLDMLKTMSPGAKEAALQLFQGLRSREDAPSPGASAAQRALPKS